MWVNCPTKALLSAFLWHPSDLGFSKIMPVKHKSCEASRSAMGLLVDYVLSKHQLGKVWGSGQEMRKFSMTITKEDHLLISVRQTFIAYHMAGTSDVTKNKTIPVLSETSLAQK